MKVSVSWTNQPLPDLGFDEAWKQLIQSFSDLPQLVFVFSTVGYDINQLMPALLELPPEVQVLGCTSCQGVMSHAGFLSAPTGGLGLLGFSDPEGAIGVGLADLTQSACDTARQALKQAILAADREGESPDLVFVSASPGIEEEIIQGIESLVGKNIPVIGGSAADNEVSGLWQIFSKSQVISEGVIIAVFYCSGKLLFAFHSGYDPSGEKAQITQAADRTLYQLDGKPAAEVYNHWTNGILDSVLAQQTGNILSQTTLFPLGRWVGQIGEIPYFQLSHPERVLAGGALRLFADMVEGEDVWLMRGTPESLIQRAGNVARAALETQEQLDVHRIRGALVIYCAGCMLTIQPRMEEVVLSLRQALGEVPFLGAFTFGEQGCFPGGENRHGNLMISVLVFYDAL
ncbi:MAG: FIST C-terminal domain-containing protein [Candidatus Sericytochromatia bacterium]|nr:FIST C-terminal domain-containing protein [Candidatus Sericytochromatia bacterium]